MRQWAVDNNLKMDKKLLVRLTFNLIVGSNYSSMSRMGAKLDQDEFQSYKAAFDAFDWNHNGKISYASLQVREEEFY